MSAQDNPFADPPAANGGAANDNTVAIPTADEPEPVPQKPDPDPMPVAVPQAQQDAPIGAVGVQPVVEEDRSQSDRSTMIFRDIALILLCSGFLMAETARECDDSGECDDNMAWGVACGVICTVVALGWMLLLRFGPGKTDPEWGQGKEQQGVCLFFLCMYIGAAGVLTFDGPYTATGNGYFFSWGGFVASGHAVYLAIDFIHNFVHSAKSTAELVQIEKRMIMGCLVASIIELIAASVQCHKHECTDKIGFGVGIGVIASFYSTVLLVMYDKLTNVIPYLAAFLSLFWGIGAVVLTFKGGPFNITGNGYFSSWAAVLFSFGLTFLTSRHLVAAKLDSLENGAPTGSAQPVDQAHTTNEPGEVPSIPAAKGPDHV